MTGTRPLQGHPDGSSNVHQSGEESRASPLRHIRIIRFYGSMVKVKRIGTDRVLSQAMKTDTIQKGHRYTG
jgi:hypothetical protein